MQFNPNTAMLSNDDNSVPMSLHSGKHLRAAAPLKPTSAAKPARAKH